MSFAEEVDSLHHPWQLPFEVVDLAPHQSVPVWGIVLDDGNVLEDSEHWVYALVARVNENDHVLCASPEEREIARQFLRSQSVSRAAWLLRLARSEADVVVFRGPEKIQPRRIHEKNIALLMDYGKVLCHFDHSWFTWGHAAVFGQEAPPHALLEVEQLRPAFESGDLAEDEFFHLACRHLHLIPADRKLFEAAWSNILRLNEDMVALARRALAQDGWVISVVSNTDPIMVRQSRDRFGLTDLFEGGVFSHAESVRPKHEDASMWQLAQRSCAMRLGEEPALTIAVDDVAANLDTAAEVPSVHQRILFRNPYQWWYELGLAGAYLPRVRDTASREPI